jgi:hypothetical protein
LKSVVQNKIKTNHKWQTSLKDKYMQMCKIETFSSNPIIKL